LPIEAAITVYFAYRVVSKPTTVAWLLFFASVNFDNAFLVSSKSFSSLKVRAGYDQDKFGAQRSV